MAGAEAACPAPPAPPQHAPLEGDGEDPRPPVLLLRPLLFPLEGALSERFRLLKAWDAPVPRHEFLVAHAKQVTVVLCSAGTRIDAETIASLPTLRCVVTTSIGVDHIDLAECRRRGISVANAGTMFSEDTADYAVGILIDVLRRISAANRDVRRGLWSSKGEHPLGSKVLQSNGPLDELD